jgi:hypothetical protein
VPFHIYIYREPRCGVIDFAEIVDHVQDMLPAVEVTLRGPLLEEAAGGAYTGEDRTDAVATSMARAKVRDPARTLAAGVDPLPGEIAYERRRLADKENGVYGLMYDGYALSDLCARLIPSAESGHRHVHVIFTNQLLGTWGENDGRYHARAVVCGAPSIVSTSGLVEAPAKSPGYYLARRGAEAFGLDEESKLELASSFADDCLCLDDERLTEVSKGYAMQAINHRLTGEPFCEDKGCRLFNAHWQS